MAIKKTIYFADFYLEFKKNPSNDFNLKGLSALYDYYIEKSEALGEDIEFDITSMCCGWQQYNYIDTMLKDNGVTSLHELELQKTVIKVDEQCYIVEIF